MTVVAGIDYIVTSGNPTWAILEDTIAIFKPKGIVIVMGDFNAKIGSTAADTHLRKTVAPYGRGTRNKRGNRLIQLATDNNLSIMNTMFKHHKRRLYLDLSEWTIQKPNKLHAD